MPSKPKDIDWDAKLGSKLQVLKKERQTILMTSMPKDINWDAKLGVKTPNFVEGTTNDGNALKAKGCQLGHYGSSCTQVLHTQLNIFLMLYGSN